MIQMMVLAAERTATIQLLQQEKGEKDGDAACGLMMMIDLDLGVDFPTQIQRCCWPPWRVSHGCEIENRISKRSRNTYEVGR